MPQPIDLGRIQIIKALMAAGKIPQDVGVSPQGTFSPNSVSFANQPISAPISQSLFNMANQKQPPASNPIQVQPAAQPSPIIPPTTLPQAAGKAKSTFFQDVILPMLPSLISTGVGLAVPGALAGAAGFNQGYAGAMEKGRERKYEQDVQRKKEDKETAKEKLRREPTDKEIMDQAIAAYKASRSQTMSTDPDPIKSTQAIYETLKQKYAGEGSDSIKLDESTAASILQQAGGDKEKARAIAKQQGYKF
jgi:hypothetical protein